jgi:hypothetical protein
VLRYSQRHCFSVSLTSICDTGNTIHIASNKPDFQDICGSLVIRATATRPEFYHLSIRGWGQILKRFPLQLPRRTLAVRLDFLNLSSNFHRSLLRYLGAGWPPCSRDGILFSFLVYCHFARVSKNGFVFSSVAPEADGGAAMAMDPSGITKMEITDEAQLSVTEIAALIDNLKNVDVEASSPVLLLRSHPFLQLRHAG